MTSGQRVQISRTVLMPMVITSGRALNTHAQANAADDEAMRKVMNNAGSLWLSYLTAAAMLLDLPAQRRRVFGQAMHGGQGKE